VKRERNANECHDLLLNYSAGCGVKANAKDKQQSWLIGFD